MAVDKIEVCQDDTQNWVVQKFGGTSIGKYPLNVVENVIKPATYFHRVVVVCSARSTSTKDEGTTNRLLQAYKQCLRNSFDRSKALVDSILTEHASAAYHYVKNPTIASKLVQDIETECDQVIQLLQATKVIGHGTPSILDKIVSTGERLACFFISAILRDRGVSSEPIDLSAVVPPNTHKTFDQVSYDSLPSAMARRINKCQATVPVVTGFFGHIDGGLLAQAGRGYTDLCASLISIGLQAQEFQVWKEVEGIFTADPSKVPNARMLPMISSEEASELTFHGSEVVHCAAMRLAMRARVSMRIKNVLNPQALGTLVVDEWNSVDPWLTPPPSSSSSSLDLTTVQDPLSQTCEGIVGGPTAITSKDRILLIIIRSRERLKPHSFLVGIFSVFDKWNMSIDLISISEAHISMALHTKASFDTSDHEDSSESDRQDLRSTIAQLQEFGDVELLYNRAIVSLIGKQVRRAAGVAGQMVSILSENRIKIEMIAHGASEISFSCVIQEQDVGRAVALLHAVFFTSPSNQSGVPTLELRPENRLVPQLSLAGEGDRV